MCSDILLKDILEDRIKRKKQNENLYKEFRLDDEKKQQIHISESEGDETMQSNKGGMTLL